MIDKNGRQAPIAQVPAAFMFAPQLVPLVVIARPAGFPV
jgi:hypothetical protein